MPLSAAPVSRIRKHTRSVRFEGYARADGLWDSPPHRRQPRRRQEAVPLDRCHALDSGGKAVRLYYPRWQRAAKTGTD
jgi:hypothetical protein